MKLNQEFWNQRYIEKNTGWDLGHPSPPLVAIFDSIEDRNASILIPGCGSAYEANYLLSQGFSNVTLIDIAPELVSALKLKFKEEQGISIICADFFEHQGQYDYIIEQTFFCALQPSLRGKYVQKMNSLLNTNGILTGVMFNREFEKDGPPFGGDVAEYKELFTPLFDVAFEQSPHSIDARVEIVVRALPN